MLQTQRNQCASKICSVLRLQSTTNSPTTVQNAQNLLKGFANRGTFPFHEHSVRQQIISRNIFDSGFRTWAAAVIAGAKTKRSGSRLSKFRKQKHVQGKPNVQTTEVHLKAEQYAIWLRFLSFTGSAVLMSPAILWVGAFVFSYLRRVTITMQDIMEPCKSFRHKTQLFGKEEQEALMRRYCESPPKQVCVLVGCNDGGKSALMNQILNGRRKTVHVAFQCRAVTGVSSFVQVLAESFKVSYLKLRIVLADVLPFAGGEIFVLKERFTEHDLKELLTVATEALEAIKRQRKPDDDPVHPVIYLDGIGDNLNGWQDTSVGHETLQILLAWAVYVTKERQLAHVILGTTPSFVSRVLYSFRDIHNNLAFIEAGDLSEEKAREYIHMRNDLAKNKGSSPLITPEDADLITQVVGGRVNDINRVFQSLNAGLEGNVSGVLRSMARHQRERILNTFVEHGEQQSNSEKDSEEDDDDDEDDYLDPLKKKYSLLVSQGNDEKKKEDEAPPWTAKQLWSTMELLVDSRNNHVPYHTLRNTVFEGNEAPLRSLIDHDILGCRIGNEPGIGSRKAMESGGNDMHVDHVYVTAYSPLLLNVFKGIIRDPRLKAMIDKIKREEEAEEQKCKDQARREALRVAEKSLAKEKEEVLRSIKIWKELQSQADDARAQKMIEHLLNLQDRVMQTEADLLQSKNSLEMEIRQRALFASRRLPHAHGSHRLNAHL